jgi:predicted glycosyltransferase
MPQMNPTDGCTVWIDMDNTPHVPFFIPVIRELEKRGHRVVLTARDAFQVCELADRKGLRYLKVGQHYGKNSLMKVAGLFCRAAQLLPFYLREKPDVALSHGARAQMLLANLMGIPTILVMDYEHIKTPPLVAPRWEIVPDALPTNGLHSSAGRVRKYRGIKEDVYAPDFKPDPGLADELGLREAGLVVTVRPPANEAHYHNPESELLLNRLMTRICNIPRARAVMLPRNRQQEQSLRSTHPQWFEDGRTIIPSHAVDGLSLLWLSDLVVSGGGTMNREAAALGVPVYSIFRGKTGAVDRRLEEEGRLTLVSNADEVEKKVELKPRDKTRLPDNRPRAALQDIVDHVEDILQTEGLRKG